MCLSRNDPLGDVEHHLVNQKVVGRDLAGDHRLTEAPRRVNRNLRPVAVARVEGESHSGRPRVHHLLHHHAHFDAAVLVAHLLAVARGSVGKQARPAPAHRVDNVVAAPHPQVRVVLTRERGVGRILTRGRRSHRNGHVVGIAAAAQFGVAVADLFLNRGRNGHGTNGVANRAAALAHHRGVAHVEVAQVVRNLGVDVTGIVREPIGPGGDREPRGHRQPGVGHLAQARGLAAHLVLQPGPVRLEPHQHTVVGAHAFSSSRSDVGSARPLSPCHQSGSSLSSGT
ncbi:unannotated protein [freshwater metagenome]|uniref:Unannotated protein n=1 Tax=freshwater metagenome TaxID=449393 RepID=A0A6J7PJ42_9ZZZZ